ncbi:MAG TPA: mercuric reductase [Vicinamibacteria bacterium]|nr:mercuric reductase [Vicinamibacteria bacterium]
MGTRESYEAIVIGTGQAGKPLARSLAEAGRRTAIIEKEEKVGGSCVVRGCTPTKTMVASARVAYLARRATDYGVSTGPVSVDLDRVRERKRKIVDRFSEGNRKGLEQQANLELIFGEASFLSEREIRVTRPDRTEARLKAPLIFINAGARPSVPDIPGLSDVPYLDSTSIMELARVPDHLVIIGGGYISVEFGQMFRRFGARVTIVQRREQLLPREDEDVATELATILREEGIDTLVSSVPQSVARNGEGSTILVVDTPEGGRTVSASVLLVATGRVPDTAGLNLEAAGIEVDPGGFIPVNERLETQAEGIYALGDVKGGPAFTHISYDDYRIIERNLLGDGKGTIRGRFVPYTVFTDPELGRVGLSERQAKAEGLAYRVAKLPMSHVARALESDETRGFMKAVVETDTDRILGAAILGVNGGEVMSVVQVAMMGGLSARELRDGVFAHPTLSESLNNLFMKL